MILKDVLLFAILLAAAAAVAIGGWLVGVRFVWIGGRYGAAFGDDGSLVPPYVPTLFVVPMIVCFLKGWKDACLIVGYGLSLLMFAGFCYGWMLENADPIPQLIFVVPVFAATVQAHRVMP